MTRLRYIKFKKLSFNSNALVTSSDFRLKTLKFASAMTITKLFVHELIVNSILDESHRYGQGIVITIMSDT